MFKIRPLYGIPERLDDVIKTLCTDTLNTPDEDNECFVKTTEMHLLSCSFVFFKKAYLSICF